MSNFLGLASGWWSVAGLIADLAGVAILTIDLWPEYQLHKTHLAIDAAERANVEAKVLRRRIANLDTDQGLPAENPQLRQARLEHLTFSRDTEDMTARSHIMSAAGYLKVPVPEVFADEFRNATAWFDKAIDALRSLEGARRREVRGWRPPLGLGVFLIVVGFLLQMAGSLPV